MNKELMGQIASLLKAAVVAAALTVITVIETDAPTDITSTSVWPLVVAVLTYVASEVERWSKK